MKNYQAFSEQESCDDYCKCYSSRKKMEMLKSKCRVISQLEKDAKKKEEMVATLRLTLQEKLEHCNFVTNNKNPQGNNLFNNPNNLTVSLNNAGSNILNSNLKRAQRSSSQENNTGKGLFKSMQTLTLTNNKSDLLMNIDSSRNNILKENIRESMNEEEISLAEDGGFRENGEEACIAEKCESNMPQKGKIGSTMDSKQLKPPKIAIVYHQSATLTYKNQHLERLNSQLTEDKMNLSRKLKELEKSKKTLLEKNKKILMRSVDLNNEHRRLEIALKSFTDENNKLNEIQTKNRQQIQNISTQLNHEKKHCQLLKQRLDELDLMKQKTEEHLKVIAALKESALEKDRRIESFLSIIKKHKIKVDNHKANTRAKNNISLSDDVDSLGPFDDENYSIQSENSLFSETSNPSRSPYSMNSSFLPNPTSHGSNSLNSSLFINYISSPDSNGTLRLGETQVESKDMDKALLSHTSGDIMTNNDTIGNFYSKQENELHSGKFNLLTINQELNKKVSELEAMKSKLESDLREAREQIELFEFRILELEDCKHKLVHSDSNKIIDLKQNTSEYIDKKSIQSELCNQNKREGSSISDSNSVASKIDLYERCLNDFKYQMKTAENEDSELAIRLTRYQVLNSDLNSQVKCLQDQKLKVDTENVRLVDELSILNNQNKVLTHELDVYKSDVSCKNKLSISSKVDMRPSKYSSCIINPQLAQISPTHVYEELRGQYETLKAEHTNCQTDKVSIHDIMTRSQEEKDIMSEEIEGLKIAESRMLEKLDAKETELVRLKREAERTRQELKIKYESEREDKLVLECKLKTELKYVRNLRVKNETISENLSLANNTMTAIAEENKVITSKFQNALNESTQLKQSHVNLKLNLEKLEQRNSDLEEVVSIKENEVTVLKGKVNCLELQVQAFEEKEYCMKRDVCNLRKDITDLRLEMVKYNILDGLLANPMEYIKKDKIIVSTSNSLEAIIDKYHKHFTSQLSKFDKLELELTDHLVDEHMDSQEKYLYKGDDGSVDDEYIRLKIQEIKDIKRAIEMKITYFENQSLNVGLSRIADHHLSTDEADMAKGKLLNILNSMDEKYALQLNNYELVKRLLEVKLKEGELIEMISEMRKSDFQLKNENEVSSSTSQLENEGKIIMIPNIYQGKDINNNDLSLSDTIKYLNERVVELQDQERHMTETIDRLAKSERALTMTLNQADEMIIRREKHLHFKIKGLEYKAKRLQEHIHSFENFNNKFNSLHGSDSCLYSKNFSSSFQLIKNHAGGSMDNLNGGRLRDDSITIISKGAKQRWKLDSALISRFKFLRSQVMSYKEELISSVNIHRIIKSDTECLRSKVKALELENATFRDQLIKTKSNMKSIESCIGQNNIQKPINSWNSAFPGRHHSEESSNLVDNVESYKTVAKAKHEFDSLFNENNFIDKDYKDLAKDLNELNEEIVRIELKKEELRMAFSRVEIDGSQTVEGEQTLLKLENVKLREKLVELNDLQNLVTVMKRDYFNTQYKMKRMESKKFEIESKMIFLQSQLEWMITCNNYKDKLIDELKGDNKALLLQKTCLTLPKQPTNLDKGKGKLYKRSKSLVNHKRKVHKNSSLNYKKSVQGIKTIVSVTETRSLYTKSNREEISYSGNGPLGKVANEDILLYNVVDNYQNSTINCKYNLNGDENKSALLKSDTETNKSGIFSSMPHSLDILEILFKPKKLIRTRSKLVDPNILSQSPKERKDRMKRILGRVRHDIIKSTSLSPKKSETSTPFENSSGQTKQIEFPVHSSPIKKFLKTELFYCSPRKGNDGDLIGNSQILKPSPSKSPLFITPLDSNPSNNSYDSKLSSSNLFNKILKKYSGSQGRKVFKNNSLKTKNDSLDNDNRFTYRCSTPITFQETSDIEKENIQHHKQSRTFKKCLSLSLLALNIRHSSKYNMNFLDFQIQANTHSGTLSKSYFHHSDVNLTPIEYLDNNIQKQSNSYSNNTMAKCSHEYLYFPSSLEADKVKLLIPWKSDCHRNYKKDANIYCEPHQHNSKESASHMTKNNLFKRSYVSLPTTPLHVHENVIYQDMTTPENYDNLMRKCEIIHQDDQIDNSESIRTHGIETETLDSITNSNNRNWKNEAKITLEKNEFKKYSGKSSVMLNFKFKENLLKLKPKVGDTSNKNQRTMFSSYNTNFVKASSSVNTLVFEPPKNFFINFIVGDFGLCMVWSKPKEHRHLYKLTKSTHKKDRSTVRYANDPNYKYQNFWRYHTTQDAPKEAEIKNAPSIVGYKITINASKYLDVMDKEQVKVYILDISLREPIHLGIQSVYSTGDLSSIVYALYRGCLLIRYKNKGYGKPSEPSSNKDIPKRSGLTSEEHRSPKIKYLAIYAYKLEETKNPIFKAGDIVTAQALKDDPNNYLIHTKYYLGKLPVYFFEN
ncbi:unnamed protein product [Gordionus sp. m RMFG-2023]